MKPFGLPPWARRDLASVRTTVRNLVPESLRSVWDGGTFDLPGLTDTPIRPYLVLLVARHYGCTGDRVVRLAASVQMIHIASLLHDRLGRAPGVPGLSLTSGPEFHQREALDILLGDLFFSKASCLIVEDGERRIIEENIRTSLASAETQGRLVAMQAEPSHLVEPRGCFEVVADKVSLLLSLGLRMGAIIGRAQEQQEEALAEFGHLLGRVLRILDDLSMWCLSPDNGSAPVPDQARFGYPMLLLWEKEGREVWEELLEGMGDSEENASERIRARLETGGYLAASRRAACRMAEQAVRCLDGMPETDELRLLRAIPGGLLDQEHDPTEEAFR